MVAVRVALVGVVDVRARITRGGIGDMAVQPTPVARVEEERVITRDRVNRKQELSVVISIRRGSSIARELSEP